MKRAVSSARSAVSRVLLQRQFFVACLTTAVLIRLVWILAVDARPISDFGWYYSKGLQIAAGHGYVVTDDGFPLWKPGNPLACPQPTAFWPVGYSGFLGTLFCATSWFIEPLLSAKLANVIFYLGIIVSMSYCTATIFSSALAGRTCALLLAFLPNHIAYTSLTSVEIFFTFLVTSGVALLLLAEGRFRWIAFIGAGIVFGVAALTKPQAILLPAIVLLALYHGDWRALLRRLSIVYIGVLLCLMPWTLRNYEVFDGRFVFVSNNGGINLLIGNMPGSWGNDGQMWNKELDGIITTINDEVERDRAARAVALSYISENFGKVALSLPSKFVATYLADVDGFGWNRDAAREMSISPFWLPLRIVSQLYYMMLVGASLVCVWRWRQYRSRYFALGPVVFMYFSLMYMLFFGGARFHFPVVPWFAAYAAGLFASGLQRTTVPASVTAQRSMAGAR